LNWNETCFVGDDVIDLGPLTRAGLAVAVGDAVPEAKAAAHWVTKAAGGRGAVREAIELILRAQGKWSGFLKHYSE
jgi:3-deoxy-D-manno-octulosonate 8-phosphate phosphatase (KDO 8-P phosphatase)